MSREREGEREVCGETKFVVSKRTKNVLNGCRMDDQKIH